MRCGDGMTDWLYLRVKGYVSKFFSFDRPRALIITDEVTNILKTKSPVGWDRMSGELFTAYVKDAMDTLKTCNPWLFL